MDPHTHTESTRASTLRKKRFVSDRTPTFDTTDPRMRGLSPLRTPVPKSTPASQAAEAKYDPSTDRKPKVFGLSTGERRWPMLMSLDDAEISVFLRKVQEFHLVRLQEDRPLIPLRHLIDVTVLPGIHRFIRNMGGHEDAERLPTEAELRDVKPQLAPSKYVTDLLNTWDQIVLHYLNRATRIRAEATNTTQADADRIIRQHLHWDTSSEFFLNALNKFTTDWHALIQRFNLQMWYQDGGLAGRDMCKMLTSLVHPAEFRSVLLDRVHREEIDSFNHWCHILISLKEFYQGVQNRVRLHKHTVDTSVHTAHKHGQGKFHKSGVKAPLALTDTDAAAAPARRDDKSSRMPRSERLPPSPCHHCGEMHWSQLCPSKPQTGESKTASKPIPTASHAPSTGRGRVKQVKASCDTSDGFIIMANIPIAFILDTGATNSFISEKQARQLLAADDNIVLTPLKTPLRVDTATEGDQGTLFANYKISAPATLRFHSGEDAIVHHLELYATAGLNTAEILIGRSTLKYMGMDIVQDFKKLCATTPLTSTGRTAHTEVEDDEQLLVATAKRAATRSDHDEIEEQPDIDTHDPVAVQASLNESLQRASASGLSDDSISRLQTRISSDLADAFRLVLSDDPPADVPPITVEMLPSIYSIKPPAVRRYNKIGSTAIANIMTKLERFNYVFKNNHATICSPAYPVRKAGVDHTAPPEQQFRLTVDLRAVNAHTIPTRFPLPRLETFIDRVSGMKFFGNLDLFNGYWQLPLHESCRQFFSIITDAGTWTPYRLIQRSTNAAGPFQAIICDVLGDLVNRACLVYIDDILIFGKTEEEFINNWITVLEKLHSVKLKISAKKTCFYSTDVKYCGRIFSKDGVSFDPNLLNTITHMSAPSTVAELRSYLATTNWIRTSIPRYSELIAPLQQLLTDALASIAAMDKPTNPKKVLLGTVGWIQIHTDTFTAINRAVAKSTSLAYPEEDKVLCVFTDASDLHWAGIVTQTSPEELTKPYLEQSHQPLAFLSGSFTGSQLHWPTIEKEGYGILATLTRAAHILQRPQGFQLFTDHRNLEYIFSPNPSTFDSRRQAADRIERWAILMRAFNYEIHHIPGEHNVAADLFSRWAANTATQDPHMEPTLMTAKAVRTRSSVTGKTTPQAGTAVQTIERQQKKKTLAVRVAPPTEPAF